MPQAQATTPSVFTTHEPNWQMGDWTPADVMKTKQYDFLEIPRPVAFETRDHLAGATLGSARAAVNEHNAMQHAHALYQNLGIDDGRLVADAAALVRLFQQSFTRKPVNLRIDVCNQTTCPKFHYDHRMIRLVTTYTGPATQYVVGDQTQRPRDSDPWALLLFKGSAHPTFGYNVYHRSPAMLPGQRRLCLVIDY
ncbi:MAG: DUF1826 domain-containing protein [Phycisphaerales bacterium JB063]